jgi:Ser/Thr protein kinase RdoA (MazF antagonist)
VTAELDGIAAFDLGDVVREPTLAARGAQGFVWRVQTTSGTYAVKQLQPWVEADPVPFDIAVQLAAREAGIPMPAPVLTADGRAVVDRVRVYEWIELAPQLRWPDASERAGEAGDLLGRIHRLGVSPVGETSTWFLLPPTEAQWRQVIGDARVRHVTSPWIDVVEADLGTLLEIGARFTVTPTATAITCHADFSPTNVLPAASDDRLVVIDWENAGPLTADAELGAALIDWTSSHDGDVDVDAARALVAAYDDHTTPIAESSFAMWVVTALNFLRVLLDNLVYDDEGHDPAFAESTLPGTSPLGSAPRCERSTCSSEAAAGERYGSHSSNRYENTVVKPRRS